MECVGAAESYDEQGNPVGYASTGVTGYEAIAALMAGGLIMIPVTRLRRTLPRYMAIFGSRNGAVICAMTMGFALLSRILVLVWIILFY